MVKIAPSLAAASMVNLERTIRTLEEAGADMLHFDIEDGSFVPAMNLGCKLIADLRPLTRLPFDVHLMMVNPEWLIPELAQWGADRVAVHYEACLYPRRVLGLIAKHNMRAGLAFNPNTRIPNLQFCLPYLKFVVVLTTEPEAQQCSFLPSVLAKVVQGKEQAGLEQVEWAVDGGVTVENIGLVSGAGADIAIVGRGIFGNGHICENIRAMKSENKIFHASENGKGAKL